MQSPGINEEETRSCWSKFTKREGEREKEGKREREAVEEGLGMSLRCGGDETLP